MTAGNLFAYIGDRSNAVEAHPAPDAQNNAKLLMSSEEGIEILEDEQQELNEGLTKSLTKSLTKIDEILQSGESKDGLSNGSGPYKLAGEYERENKQIFAQMGN